MQTDSMLTREIVDAAAVVRRQNEIQAFTCEILSCYFAVGLRFCNLIIMYN